MASPEGCVLCEPVNLSVSARDARYDEFLADGSGGTAPAPWRVCHSADVPSQSLLIRLLEVEGGAAEHDRLVNGAGTAGSSYQPTDDRCVGPAIADPGGVGAMPLQSAIRCSSRVALVPREWSIVASFSIAPRSIAGGYSTRGEEQRVAQQLHAPLCESWGCDTPVLCCAALLSPTVGQPPQPSRSALMDAARWGLPQADASRHAAILTTQPFHRWMLPKGLLQTDASCNACAAKPPPPAH